MDTMIHISPRQRLVAERLQRRWTQLEVADQIGTTSGNVSRWERGLTSPGPYFRRKLCELFGKNAQELGLTWEDSADCHAHTSALAPPCEGDNTFRQLPPFFTDREDLATLLQALLQSERHTVLQSERHTVGVPTTGGLPANSEPGGMNLSEREDEDQEQFVKGVQGLQPGANWLLLPNDVKIVVLVVLNNNGYSGPASLQKEQNNKHPTHRNDCCDDQRQGA